MFDLPSMIANVPWYQNAALIAALLSWLAAQAVKFVLGWRRRRRVDFTYFVSTGGMPSAHSASVSGLATSIGLQEGFGSPVFALAGWFALIVMFDAQSVRRAAGEQARILNQVVDELLEHHHLSQQKLAELLGHTPVQVGAGMFLGIFVALAWHA